MSSNTKKKWNVQKIVNESNFFTLSIFHINKKGQCAKHIEFFESFYPTHKLQTHENKIRWIVWIVIVVVFLDCKQI
jgi:hypothetical protein